MHCVITKQITRKLARIVCTFIYEVGETPYVACSLR